MKRFLVASANESVLQYVPKFVLALDEKEAIKRVLAKDALFRNYIFDLAAKCSFAERFYLVTGQKKELFSKTASSAAKAKLVKSRVDDYFADRPELAEQYLKYMNTENKSFITEELFEYLASKERPTELGLVALNVEHIEVITARNAR
jgi:hypothetical protein